MPQPGQRIPQRTRIVQGGSPSCWWVPSPRESGSSPLATISRAIGKIAVANAVARKPPD